MSDYRHLSGSERDQTGVLRAAGHSLSAIALCLKRARTTVWRELKRNALPSGNYSPVHATGAYILHRQREALLEKDQHLRTFVIDRLTESRPGEEIAGWLKTGAEHGLRAPDCETIYAFIYRASQKTSALWRRHARRHKRRKPTRARPSRDTIKDRASIHEQPAIIEGRTEVGHWEGDLIFCKRMRPVLVLHERKSHLTLAARLTGKTAGEAISYQRPMIDESIMKANLAKARARGTTGISHTCHVRTDRQIAAKIYHFRQ